MKCEFTIGVRKYWLLYLDNRGYILKKVREEAVKMFMVLMFTLLPLYYSDNYYNILNDKRDIYWLFSRILFVVIAVSLWCCYLAYLQLCQRYIVPTSKIPSPEKMRGMWEHRWLSAVLLFILSFPDATAEREISGYICISAVGTIYRWHNCKYAK